MKFKQDFKLGVRMIQLLGVVIMVVHWVACIWYIIVREPGTWMPCRDLNYNYTSFYTDTIVS